MNISIRPYKQTDRDSVIHLLKLNTPGFFAPEEEKDLIYYLEHELEFYFVLDYDSVVVGCGGFNFSGNKHLGKISWDILHPDYQGKALGSRLLNYRIEKLKEFKDLEKIMVRTTQLAWKFYEKAGFKLVEVVENYWAKGFDLYKMELDPKNTINLHNK